MKKFQAPKISVIMSVYNGMPYLPKAVQSILNQTYKNFEFIIVDDTSVDNTWNYLKNLKDKRVRLIKNKKNLGLAKSLNIALQQTQGDYVARMDADDISLSNRLEKQLGFMLKNPDVDLCGSWVELIDEEGNEVGKKTGPLYDRQIKRSLSIYPAIIHSTFFGKKDFFIKLKGYRPEFDGAEEYDLLMRARKSFKMANIPKALLKWRLRNDRRSITLMDEMHNLDLMIKRESLQRDGYSLLGLYGYLKLLFFSFIPIPIKIKIARFLKMA